ncbi:hypothetical protein KAK07_19095 [Ideonella sp. 4Y16]|uniref:Uncharacterized protein n=1 Tax=Ideonella alba TaxID=2824118 RepID=A0A941BFE7_9BURK|nr:hypothetical protein [Ideonella alba]MBQ0929343.1 hypothetical protein [Ideonella alba]MBQ0945453.1 hypothetical protein [Ideonella alba]
MKRLLIASVRILVGAACVMQLGSAAAQSLSGDFGGLWEEWRTQPGSADPMRRQQAGLDQARQEGERFRRNEQIEDAAKKGAKEGFERAGAIAEKTSELLGWASDNGGEQLEELARMLRDSGWGRSADATRAVRKALERAGLVDPDDSGNEPSGAPDGQPGVPSACAAVDGGAASGGRRTHKPGAARAPGAAGHPCEACYTKAINALDSTRTRLEKLRAIYSSTYKSAKAQMAFADSVSGVHGVSGLAWQTQKIKIMQSVKNLDKAYDAKYAELMQALLKDLQQYSECEETIMKVPSWYDRFGFVYYQFMKDHYKRPVL